MDIIDILDKFKRHDQIKEAKEELIKRIAARPSDVYLWHNGTSMYIHALLTNLTCLEALHEAYINVIDKLEDLLPPCDLPTEEGDYAIHLAVLNDLKDECMFLVKTVGVNVNVRDKDGNTPLHLACMFNRKTIAKYLLLEASVNPNIVNGALQSPLLISAFKKDYEMMRLLVRKGAKVSFYAGRFLVSVTDALQSVGGHETTAFIHKLFREAKNKQRQKKKRSKENARFRDKFDAYSVVCRRNANPLADAQKLAKTFGVKHDENDSFETVCDKMGSNLVAKKKVE
jgi:Ankyrin repeats (3 copies)